MKTHLTPILLQAISSRSISSEIGRDEPQPERNGENTTMQTSQLPQRIEIAFADDSNAYGVKILTAAR